jgi:hypothetical protein
MTDIRGAINKPFSSSACKGLMVMGALLVAACAAPRPAHSPPLARELDVRTVSTCVASAGALTEVRVEVSAATGDTTFHGQPFHTAFPLTPDYATGASWFERHEPIPESVRPKEDARGDYEKYGPTVGAPADSLVRVGSHQGVSVFAERDDAYMGVLYVPVQPGCWFQRYQFVGVGEVRDG